ncbi:DNA polymerase III subunit gamma/tau [Dechloromonas sp. H13]|uniref:DNA polymerase III subunit gamma/tau n=1 Tax=Dechloromonas sp. H13 TaxID=2570193 RepID=UPI0012921F89|nr:DNA polymerase III subunit gamma/tau [Dechloromonas sp. H13]
MSYQVLARKWRPRSFSSLVGQEHVVRALTHALSSQRLHHAYLFTGTRGVGKTTLARILAKSLNCETGVTATPCGVCSICQEIDGGRFVDLLEVDAATNTRVDEMRQLLENAVYAPTRGRYKVYVIDEVHMLSNSAFNAMLKTLEEPPEHVKFILATTDPQKIPVTVLSRCLQFNLKQMPPVAIASHLAHVLQAEGVPFEQPALALIARSASGSMRDALSLLDQAIAHGAGRVEEGQVRAMLGTVDLDYLYGIVEAVEAGEIGELLRIAADMALRSISFGAALQELAGLLTRLQVAQLAPGSIDDEDPDHARRLDLAARLSPEFVQLAYQIVLHGRAELPMAPDEYAGFMMTLMRLHGFRPESVADVVSSVKAAVQRPTLLPKSEPVAAATVAESVANPGKAALPPTSRGAAVENGPWYEMVAALQLNGLARELAQHCELRELSDGDCVLRLAPAHGHLQMKPAPDKLRQALSDYLGRPIALRFELAQTEADTPAATVGRERRERQDQAIASIEQDSFVRDVIESCDASLVESSIKPIE